MIPAILTALVNGALVGGAVTAGVWLVLRLAPRRTLNAATRYAIWWAVLGVVTVLPVAYWPGHAEKQTSVATPSIESTAVVEEAPVLMTPMAPIVNETAARSTQWPRFPVEIPAGRWPGRILMAWAAIAAMMMLRLAASWVLLERRKAHAFAVPAEVAASMADWLAICGTRRRITLAGSSEIATPMAAGPWRPSVLIPAALLAELDQAEMDQVGLHEVAHLARWDDYALMVQRAMEAVLVLHPVIRFIARQIDLEREIACDDFVVETTGRARTYAICLTRIVELSGGARGSLVAAAATEERSHLARRVEMLLDRTRHTGTRLLKARLTAVVVALGAMAWMAAKAPGVVAFAMPIEQSVFTQDVPPPAAPVAPMAPAAPRAAAARRSRALEAPMALDAPPAAPLAGAAEPQSPPLPPAPASPASPPSPQSPPSPPSPASPSSPQSPPSPASPPSPMMNRFDGVDWHSRDGLNARDLRIHGNVEFTDDETDVKSVSAGGWFSYEESFGFSSRRYQVAGDGTTTRRYTVDGRERALDEEGRAWLRVSIPYILRESGINAGARVRRILRQGGAQAVIAEIGRIQSSGPKSRYIQELVPIGNLSADQYQTVLRMVRGIPGDGDKASLAIFLAKYTLKDNLRDYLFEAISSINSSGDKRRVLTEVTVADPTRATLEAVAKVAAGIPSDGDKASVLVGLARHFRGNEEMRRPFFRAAESINSSGDRAQVLMSALDSSGSDRDILVDALRAAATIPSDGDKSRVLRGAASYWREDDAVRRAFFDAANTVNSSGDHGHVLLAVVMRAGVGAATLIDAVHSADRIPSDGDKGQVLSVVVGRTDASNEVLIAAVQAAARLNSDGDKVHVLMEAVDRSSGKAPVRNEIRTAAKTLHADSDYRRVISALERQAAL